MSNRTGQGDLFWEEGWTGRSNVGRRVQGHWRTPMMIQHAVRLLRALRRRPVRYIIFPIHLSNHWAVVVVDNGRGRLEPVQGTIEYYDSSWDQAIGELYCTAVRNWLDTIVTDHQEPGSALALVPRLETFFYIYWLVI